MNSRHATNHNFSIKVVKLRDMFSMYLRHTRLSNRWFTFHNTWMNILRRVSKNTCAPDKQLLWRLPHVIVTYDVIAIHSVLCLSWPPLGTVVRKICNEIWLSFSITYSCLPLWALRMKGSVNVCHVIGQCPIMEEV